MVGSFFLLILSNAFLFTFIFWGLTFLAKCTYSNKWFNYKLTFYECGFKNYSTKKAKYELNLILVVLIMLIYDGEFLMLLPYALNADVATLECVYALFFFMLWFIITLIYEYSHHALEWQI